MNLAVSNIAWPADQDDAALRLASECGFNGIELAPQKTFGDWDTMEPGRVRDYRRRLEAMGLCIPALQAILFGQRECELFRSSATRTNLRAHLRRVAILAGELGARACVFGAPTMRDPGALPAEEAWQIAVEFLAEMAEAFQRSGTVLAFEANPPAYQCRFVTRTAEACRLVAEIDRPGIRVNLDGGTIFLNSESMDEVAAAAPRAAHFHASEPHLVPLGSTAVGHRAVAQALASGGYQGWRSVEMRAQGDWDANLRRAAQVMKEQYANEP